jgi:hypothetical protein
MSMMSVLRAAGLFAANSVWRLSGAQSAGRVLMNALDAQDAGVRTIAGILLVRGGKKAVPLIQEAIQREINLPQTLVIAGDLGVKSLEPELKKFVNHPDPNIAKAATNGLRILAAQRLDQTG